LRSVGDHYEFTNGSYLSVVCAPDTSSGGQSPETLSRVLSRITDAIFSTKVSEQDKAEAIRQLGDVDAGTVIPPLRNFIASAVGRQTEFLRAEALVALLNHKDQSVVGLAESELLSGSASYWMSNLLFALTRAVPPSRSIPILAKVLALPGAEMRTSAAVAIYQTDSPEGIPPLLQALDDPDPQVAFAVMQGLGNLTKHYGWRPKSTEPDADWFRCRNHWRDFRQSWNKAR
jgi:HEAT repeat protein